MLVIFEPAPQNMADSPALETEASAGRDAHVLDLERELQNTRESHQTAIEEMESTNEELKSTNEELQSTNEELQSTNEELESSKEELQSLNEELLTVNSELQSKVEELSAAHDDIRNLLNGTEIATIFVDNALRVRRFTREATDIVNLIPTDIGRPLEHVKANLEGEDLIACLESVLDTLTPREKEVRTLGGRWYKMRVMPYRTTDNRIDGAVLTFAGIDVQKEAQEVLARSGAEVAQARILAKDVIDLNPEPLAVIDENGGLVLINTLFRKCMGLGQEDVTGMDVFSLTKGALKPTDLRTLMRKTEHPGVEFSTRPFLLNRTDGPRSHAIEGRILGLGHGKPRLVLIHLAEMPEGAGNGS